MTEPTTPLPTIPSRRNRVQVLTDIGRYFEAHGGLEAHHAAHAAVDYEGFLHALRDNREFCDRHPDVVPLLNEMDTARPVPRRKDAADVLAFGRKRA